MRPFADQNLIPLMAYWGQHDLGGYQRERAVLKAVVDVTKAREHLLQRNGRSGHDDYGRVQDLGECQGCANMKT